MSAEYNPRYRIYRTVEVPMDCGRAVVVSLGCNGQYHVDLIDKVCYGADGRTVEDAEHVMDIEHGLCVGDNACSTDEEHGFFRVDPYPPRR